MHGLNLSSPLLCIEPTKVNVAHHTIRINAHGRAVQLVIVVHLIVDALRALEAFLGVLALILFHHVEVALVVDLEATRLDLVLPDLVVQLDVVKDGVDEALDVRILIS